MEVLHKLGKCVSSFLSYNDGEGSSLGLSELFACVRKADGVKYTQRQ
jgi:hypothetical protein